MARANSLARCSEALAHTQVQDVDLGDRGRVIGAQEVEGPAELQARRPGPPQVDGGAGSGPGSGEAALDIEDVIGLAPKARMFVYQGPNSNSGGPGAGPYDTYSAIVSQNEFIGQEPFRYWPPFIPSALPPKMYAGSGFQVCVVSATSVTYGMMVLASKLPPMNAQPSSIDEKLPAETIADPVAEEPLTEQAASGN